MEFLHTQRLVLRTMQPKDAPILYDYRNNELCSRFQRGQVRTLPEIKDLIARHEQDVPTVDTDWMAAVVLRETDELVGEIVVMPKEQTISLGYTFSYRHHRKGYAYEALSALIRLLHERYPDWEFISFTEPENTPSMGLLKKLGYTHLCYSEPMHSEVFGKWFQMDYWGPRMEFLRTKRLILRKFRDSDFDDFYAYARDAEMSRMMGRDLITDPASAMPTFLWLKDREPRGYALVLRETGRVIGNLTVSEPPQLVAALPQTQGKTGKSLSFSVSHTYQRRGLMQEALNALIHWLFSQEQVDYVNCGYLDFNIPSRELQRKLGFTALTTETFQADGREFTAIEQILWNPHL